MVGKRAYQSYREKNSSQRILFQNVQAADADTVNKLDKVVIRPAGRWIKQVYNQRVLGLASGLQDSTKIEVFHLGILQ